MGRAPATSAFTQLFRAELNKVVEYSFGPDPGKYGTMVVGVGDIFLGRLRQFAALVPDGRHWAAAIGRLAEASRPPAFLFKVDGNANALDAATLYGRYRQPLDEASCRRALPPGSGFNAPGPSPHALGSLLGSDGPMGIGLRTDAAGGRASAVYFDVASRRDDFCARQLPGLVRELGWTTQAGDAIAGDIAALYGPGKLGVVGAGGSASSGTFKLKFDRHDLPLQAALAFLAKKGVAPGRCRELATIAHRLRCDRASYLGLKYGPAGFDSCKLYLAVRLQNKTPSLA